jgi:hypothetical protein
MKTLINLAYFFNFFGVLEMNKLSILALVLTSFNVFADSLSTDKIESCRIIAETAETAMIHRQNNDDMAGLVAENHKRAARNGLDEKGLNLLDLIVIDAYTSRCIQQ